MFSEVLVNYYYFFLSMYVYILYIHTHTYRVDSEQHEFELHACIYMQIIFNTYLHCFLCMAEILWMWKADCMRWFTPFYVGDLSICGFRCPKGVLEPMPHARRGKIVVVVFEKSKVICGFLNVQDLALQLLYSLRVKYICKKCICVSACVFVCVFVYVVYVCTSCSKIVTIYLSLCARHFPDLSSSVTM